MIKEWIIANPKLGVVAIAVAVTFVLTLFTKYFTNQTRMKELKTMQKEKQHKLKTAADAEKETLSKEIMDHSFEMMRHSFKPMFITLLPLLFLFWWMRRLFAETALASSWIWWYIISAIASSIIIRKAMDVV